MNPKLTYMYRMPGLLLLVSVVILFSTSCGNVKGLQYVQGEFDTTKLKTIEFKEPVIQKGDILSIRVFSDDAVATQAVTSQAMPTATSFEGNNGNNGSALPTFLVDQWGDIRLYKLGVIHVEGMTKRQLSDTLAKMYEEKGLLKNPFAEVKFENYRITLVGEVGKPGVYTVPADRVSIFEAVGLAGDITPYGRRDNVLVVRETNGVREFARLDLSRSDVFTSPYFYLQQNDMVIVDVRKNKSGVNDQVTVRNITIAASVLSTIAIFINVFRR
jgi:polysaccharide export outer membrane protein